MAETLRPYSAAVVVLIDRDSGQKKQLLLYPATRIMLLDLSGQQSGASFAESLATLRAIAAFEVTGDGNWTEVGDFDD